MKLLTEIYSLITDIKNNNEIDMKLIDEIENQINDKILAMKKRELYTKSKTAQTEEEREKARLEYIEKAQIPKNFRY